MEITPATSTSAAKSRTAKVRASSDAEPAKSKAPQRAKSVSADATAGAKPEKITKSRKSPAKSPSAQPAESVTVVKPSGDELASMIAQAAYYIAAQRDFAPGNELDDWLAAEREILSRHAQ